MSYPSFTLIFTDFTKLAQQIEVTGNIFQLCLLLFSDHSQKQHQKESTKRIISKMIYSFLHLLKAKENDTVKVEQWVNQMLYGV